MIGKAKSIAHVANAINYARNKKEAVEISRNKLIGESGREIAKEFRLFQNLNARCEKNSFSIVLSPSIPDGIKLTNHDFEKLADDFLKEMKLEKQQYISYLHADDKHKHLHIYVNRIDFNGRAHKDNYISKKAQRMAESVAKKWGFTTAKEIQKLKENKVLEIIESVHKKVFPHLPKDIFQYSELMKDNGVKCILKQNSNGQVVGLRYKIGNESIKASAVNRKYSAARLQKFLLENF